MQTPKAKPGSLEVPQMKSPIVPRTARQLKSDSDSQNPARKTPKDKSPKVNERKSPRTPGNEKKQSPRVSELEAQISQLQEDLKKAKEQLNISESCKRQVLQEAEDAKRQFLVVSAKLKESGQHLMELATSEDARLLELRKISHDRDKAWQSELDAVQKQHLMDSAALASAINEIQKLKNQLDIAAESEAAQTKHAQLAHTELQGLRSELTETLSLVEKLKADLNDCRQSEAHACELYAETNKQLEMANATMEILRSDGMKAKEANKSLSIELEKSRAQVTSLEELVNQLRRSSALGDSDRLANQIDETRNLQEKSENLETSILDSELNFLKLEVEQLKSALEASENRYREDYIQSTLQIRTAYEQVEKAKLESGKREAELESELTKAKMCIKKLRADLMDKETELQNISEENKCLNLTIEKNQPSERESELEMELKKLEQNFAESRTALLDKETKLQALFKQNEFLQTEVKKGEPMSSNENSEAFVTKETAKAAKEEALMKLRYLTDEAEKSSRRAARVTEQLDAAQAANAELEAELRKLKVQSDQWRKAAEAATAMLSSTGNNGKFVEKTSSLDYHYSPFAGNVGSPNSDDMMDDVDSPKKKNGNVLKKIGGLWKKGQK